MQNLKRNKPWLVKIVGVILGLALCFAVLKNGIHPRSSKASDEGAIRIQIAGEPSSLDPNHIFDQYSIGILRNVIEGLFIIDSEGMLRNGLVARYQVSPDGLTYRFTLRPDAKWSDGKSVTIEDCIFGLMRAIDPKTGSSEVEFFDQIAGAREFSRNHGPASNVAITREENQLVIRLTHPQPSLPLVLSLPVAAPVRKDALDANHGKWDQSLPVTGPYHIVTYKPTDEVRLEPNPLHRSPGKKPVLIRVLTEEVTALNLFDSGRLDVISSVMPTEIERLKRQNRIRTAPSTTVIYLAMNAHKAPLTDITWRRAIATQIDREGLKIATRGFYEPTLSYVPNTLDPNFHPAPLKFAEDSETIRKLKKKPRLRLAFATSLTNKVMAEKIQSDLKTGLGIDVTLEPMELKSLIQRLFSDPPEMYFLGKSAFFNDAITHLDAFNSRPAPNFARYQNEEFEQMLEKIRTLPFGQERTDLVRRADRLLVEKDVVVVPMLLRLQVFGVSNQLKNFSVNPFQVIDFAKLDR